jgi:glyoxylase-like metal-dependent hydrolase (beta-lactamase superfamily II)
VTSPHGEEEVRATPRVLNAGNAGAFTLDGTRTFLVGRRSVAVIDPGPKVQEHLRALLHAVADAESVTILLTHGHADHAEGADALAQEGGFAVHGADGVPLEEGRTFETDAGALVALRTPGHSRDHFAFHWPERRALFAGDLLLGEGSTTWVGEYSGCVADYLRSLDRLRALDLAIVYPAHGPPLRDVAGTLDAYEAHRAQRIAQVRAILHARPDATPSEVVREVYGTVLPSELEEGARRSVEVMMEYLEGR